MKNQINIAELLKNCPKGMELYSPLCGECKFINVNNDIIYIESSLNKTLCFNSLGMFFEWYEESECLLFPSKDQRDWSKFQQPFKDGDVIHVCDEYNGVTFTYVVILKQIKEGQIYSYCFYSYKDAVFGTYDFLYNNYNIRLATEEEKTKLFQTIKDNGYKWNAEIKTLEKLEQTWTIQYAKDGDVLAFDDETIVIFKDLYNNTSFHSYCHIEDGIFTISKEDMPDWWRAKGFYPATEKQYTLLFRKIKEAGYHWNPETKTLEKLPKFKIGDKIIKKNGLHVPFVITGASDVYYWSNTENSIEILLVSDQDDWELVPNKFDINNLVPFESKVLVRDSVEETWFPCFFGGLADNNNYPYRIIGGEIWKYCIPYEGNEHLSGKKEDCDDFYKNW